MFFVNLYRLLSVIIREKGDKLLCQQTFYITTYIKQLKKFANSIIFTNLIFYILLHRSFVAGFFVCRVLLVLFRNNLSFVSVRLCAFIVCLCPSRIFLSTYYMYIYKYRICRYFIFKYTYIKNKTTLCCGRNK